MADQILTNPAIRVAVCGIAGVLLALAALEIAIMMEVGG